MCGTKKKCELTKVLVKKYLKIKNKIYSHFEIKLPTIIHLCGLDLSGMLNYTTFMSFTYKERESTLLRFYIALVEMIYCFSIKT